MQIFRGRRVDEHDNSKPSETAFYVCEDSRHHPFAMPVRAAHSAGE